MRDFWKKMTAILLCITMAGAFAACGERDDWSDEASNIEKEEKPVIKVGSKDFTEGLLVSEIYALALEDAGFEVERVFDIAGSLVHTALTSEEIDLYPEYTGTGLLSILGMDMITDPQEVYDTVKEEYEKQFQITWLDYSQANDGQGLAIRTAVAKKYNIKTISDLQKHAVELRFASQGDFDEREDGLPGLEKIYGEFNWKSTKVYDGGLKYEVLKKDQADVTPAYTTDGALADTENLTLLEDDKRCWPPYNLAPVVRDDVLNANPEIADALNKVSKELTTENLTQMNGRIDVDKEEYEDVAKEFYDSIK
ncbi:MAG: glycine/betaine ABC transporter substrate-binding protein [Lachnospiraceae bacterium]|nr:glycine/betaine ABC transporter substrate-binding protein [Lachnospiraceae bacterium]